jgi:hypothetical protein
MSSSSDNKVIVRVEVEVNGVAVEPKGFVKPLEILTPQPGPNDDTPVFWNGTSYSISFATGNSPVIASAFATKIQAFAYPSTSLNLLDPKYGTPDAKAVTAILSAGSWVCSQSNGNAVPGGAGDHIPNGYNNSTLLVWYTFTGMSNPLLEAICYHGLIMGSGSGAPSGSTGPIPVHSPIGARPKSTVLVARFTGGLSPLREVRLVWNGVSWVGSTHAGGGTVLTLMHFDSVYQLQASGPGVAFVVAGRPRSTDPFHWSISGTAIGAHAGDFKVDITE